MKRCTKSVFEFAIYEVITLLLWIYLPMKWRFTENIFLVETV